MLFLADAPQILFADTISASKVMASFVAPTITTLCALASLACTFFLVKGGIQYMTSRGDPERLTRAKKTTKNALVGLVLVIAAATLTAILNHTYTNPSTHTSKLPTLQTIEPAQTDNGLVSVLVNAIVGLLREIVQSVGEPFLSSLGYFLNGTPLMGDNSSVFNLWLVVVGIADALFVLVIALIGFHIMSFSALGLEEIELSNLLPQLVLGFLLANTSIFVIDAVIALSNVMIHALQSEFPDLSFWTTLVQVTKKSPDLGMAGLLVMAALLVLVIMLLVYYVIRLVTLYIGAVLSPLVLLLWLLPAFKDFAIAALKTYLTTIFVLFVHVAILSLATSIFVGMLRDDGSGEPNTLMALIVGLATVMALLKTQGIMQQLTYAASTPRAAREVAGSFMRGISYMNRTSPSYVERASGNRNDRNRKTSSLRGNTAGNANRGNSTKGKVDKTGSQTRGMTLSLGARGKIMSQGAK